MSLFDNQTKQRIIGAVVLIALAIIFLPMLFTARDVPREVIVNAPPMPSRPEPQIPGVVPVETPQPVAPGQPEAPDPPEPTHFDANGLPNSWVVQLAALSNAENAKNLQQTLRSKGYNAYLRSDGRVTRVYVGPVIERSEANRLRDQLRKQQGLDAIVVRFESDQPIQQ